MKINNLLHGLAKKKGNDDNKIGEIFNSNQTHEKIEKMCFQNCFLVSWICGFVGVCMCVCVFALTQSEKRDCDLLTSALTLKLNKYLHNLFIDLFISIQFYLQYFYFMLSAYHSFSLFVRFCISIQHDYYSFLHRLIHFILLKAISMSILSFSSISLLFKV